METFLDLERVAATHWRGTEEEWLGDWLLRAAEGFTGRANSVLPLGDPGLPAGAALAVVTRWYRDRGLPPMIVIPAPSEGESPAGPLDDELGRRGWVMRKAPAFVMVADVPAVACEAAALPAGLEFQAGPVPDGAWLAAYHYRGLADQPPVMRTVLISAADQVFVSIRAAGDASVSAGAPGAPVSEGAPGAPDASVSAGAPGAVAAIARLSLAGGWAGITAVEVSPDSRRAGLGGALTRELLALAAARGVTNVFLQVEVDNAAARRLYERAGFRYSHRYHYRVAPDPS